MSDPCDFTIAHEAPPGAGEFIRITAKDGLKVLATIDLSPSDFVSALLGRTVIAAYTRGAK